MAWASVSEDERDGLNVALNEATWAAIDVDITARRVRLLLDVLSLPPEGVSSAGSRVIVCGQPGEPDRGVAAHGLVGNDEAAEVVPLDVAGLDATVRSFGGCSLYGWEFIDPPEASWLHWRDRLSVDARLDPGQWPLTSSTCSRKAAAPSPGTSTCASGSRRSRSPPLITATSPCPTSSPQESAGGMACTPVIPVLADKASSPFAGIDPSRVRSSPCRPSAIHHQQVTEGRSWRRCTVGWNG